MLSHVLTLPWSCSYVVNRAISLSSSLSLIWLIVASVQLLSLSLLLVFIYYGSYCSPFLSLSNMVNCCIVSSSTISHSIVLVVVVLSSVALLFHHLRWRHCLLSLSSFLLLLLLLLLLASYQSDIKIEHVKECRVSLLRDVRYGWSCPLL